jgi:hypothetical protein
MSDTMYVANPTDQTNDFRYRVVATASAVSPSIPSKMIPPGWQIALPDHLDTVQKEYIVSQHAIYGMIDVGQIDRWPHFIPLIYSIGKKITSDQIRRAHDKNKRILIERGKKTRQELAIAANQNILRTMENMRLTEDGNLHAVEMSVQEDRPEGSLIKEPQISEGTRVSAADAAQGLKGTDGRKNARRSRGASAE